MSPNTTLSYRSFSSFLQVIVLVLVLSPTANCLSLDDRAQLKQLTDEFVRKLIRTFFLLFIPLSINFKINNCSSNCSYFKAKMNDLLTRKDVRLQELESKVTRLEELEAKVTQLETLELKVEELEEENKKQEEISVALQQKIDSLFSNFFPAPSSVDNNKTVVAAAGMPKSCEDLRYLGQTVNGFYLIKGTEKVETVFCDFTILPSDPSRFSHFISKVTNLLTVKSIKINDDAVFFTGFQTWIGYVDVKSSPVYFYVQRGSIVFNTTGTPIPFDVEILNVGGAMNLTSGKFTAPNNGIYAFAFTGFAYLPASSSRVYFDFDMYLNGVEIGNGLADEVGTAVQFETSSWQSTVNLQKGDQIWLQISYMSTGAYLHGNSHTQFSGCLLEEKIAIA